MSKIFVDDVVSREGTSAVGFPKGISVSVASTFSGDVSIGGTLTYEDVTNVDAVGIITARNGIKFGAAGVGGTIRANGDTTLAGVVTATSFSGDGSALTGMANTAHVSTTGLNVVGVSTFNNNVTLAAGNLDVDAGQLLVGSNVLVGPAGVATFSGTGDVHLKDDVRLNVGDGSDLAIYHNATNSAISISNGQLQINKGASENIAKFIPDGAVELYYDNSKKLSTIGYGVTVSGGACLSGLTTAFGGLTVAGTMVESMSSTTTAYNTSGDLNITNGNFHFNSANLGGTGTTLNIMSTAGINTTTKVNQVLNVTAVTAVNATTAFVNKVTVDGKATGITTHWVGGSVPSDGGGSGVDTYSFNILKTGSETYIIVANQVKTS